MITILVQARVARFIKNKFLYNISIIIGHIYQFCPRQLVQHQCAIYTKVSRSVYIAVFVILILLAGHAFLVATKFSIDVYKFHLNTAPKRVESELEAAYTIAIGGDAARQVVIVVAMECLAHYISFVVSIICIAHNIRFILHISI